MSSTVILCFIAVLHLASSCCDCNSKCCDRRDVPGVDVGNKRYYVERNLKANFVAAYEHCREIGMQLAVIRSHAEQVALQTRIREIGLANENFWISGNDLVKRGSYYWMSTGEPMIYKHFLANQPDHYTSGGKVEHCIHLVNVTFKWNDHFCDDAKLFVCETFPCNE